RTGSGTNRQMQRVNVLKQPRTERPRTEAASCNNQSTLYETGSSSSSGSTKTGKCRQPRQSQ
ncbi:hypothetical protein Lpp229_12304, partial [Lacticaseibacillus paracasei subsp. paracasei Lpp229]